MGSTFNTFKCKELVTKVLSITRSNISKRREHPVVVLYIILVPHGAKVVLLVVHVYDLEDSLHRGLALDGLLLLLLADAPRQVGSV